MTPSARLSAAMTLLDEFARPGETAMMDAILTRWARANRYAGSKDRAAVADLVYTALRRWRSSAGVCGEDGRARLLASLRAEGRSIEALAALCDGGRFAPEPLRSAEWAALAAFDPDQAAADWPDWLCAALQGSVADPAAEIAAQTVRAPVDLRVNPLRATREALTSRLAAEEGAESAPTRLSPLGLRLAAPKRVERGAAFAEGWFEIQDEASQAVGLLTAALARRGAGDRAPRILDLCAGGGGKSLAMAAAAPDAQILATDVSAKRLEALPPRALRAGAAIETVAMGRASQRIGLADAVLVDAPCSGSGAWARNPDAKWRLTPSRLKALSAAQEEALDAGARLTRPGGVLVYATCSLLAVENETAAAAFLRRQPAFRALALTEAWRAAGLSGAPSDPFGARFSPTTTGTDGFFCAAFHRGTEAAVR